jgi:hypothetical protein
MVTTMTLSFEKMDIAEKLSTMELLWDDICHSAPNFDSPDWHRVLLKEREDMVDQGKDDFEEWETAKKDILHAVS